jgi:hypothetical protein
MRFERYSHFCLSHFGADRLGSGISGVSGTQRLCARENSLVPSIMNSGALSGSLSTQAAIPNGPAG